MGRTGALLLGLICGAGLMPVRAADAPLPTSPKELVQKMLAVEDAESLRKGHYTYLSQERSERTGGHLWTERIAETNAGKLRYLIAMDGHALTAEQAAAEHARMDAIAADPEGFRKKAEALKNDEAHAKQMLDLLPKAFLLEGMRREGEFVRIDFRPDPAYSPQSLEERVLHGMAGTVLVDAKSLRLRSVEGRLPEDMSIGFGLLATIKAGSNFSTTRAPVSGNEWKTAVLDTDIQGKAVFFRAIGKKQHAEHTEFMQIPMEMTVPQAVTLLER